MITHQFVNLQTSPTIRAAATTNANPDLPAIETAALLVEDPVAPDEVAVAIAVAVAVAVAVKNGDVDAVAGPIGKIVELAPLPPLPPMLAVVVTDEGGKEVLVAGIDVF
jgi:hypothetical protein